MAGELFWHAGIQNYGNWYQTKNVAMLAQTISEYADVEHMRSLCIG